MAAGGRLGGGVVGLSLFATFLSSNTFSNLVIVLGTLTIFLVGCAWSRLRRLHFRRS